MFRALCLAAALATAAALQVGEKRVALNASSAGWSTESALKRIHLISTGRQGSCIMLDLVGMAGGGLPKVFEPLNGLVEGSSIYANYNKEKKRNAIACLFSEDMSKCGAGVINSASLGQLQEVLQTPEHPPLVIKTTRIVDLGLVAETLTPQQLHSSRFVVLVRDPRAVWASLKPWTGWAVHSIPLICTLLAETALTAPALAAAAPGRVSFAVFESWSKDLAQWSRGFADFVGMDGSGMVQYAKEKQQASAVPKWLADLTDAEVEQIESDRHCSAYMDRVGYKRGKEQGADYSALASSESLARPLSATESEVLGDISRMKQGAAPHWAGKEPLMEFEYTKYPRA